MIDKKKIQDLLNQIESIGFEKPKYEEMIGYRNRIKITSYYFSMEKIDKLLDICSANGLEFDVRPDVYKNERPYIHIEIWGEDK